MSTEPAGGTISGNNSNVITDQQLFDHAVSEPTSAPASSPPPSSPSAPPSSPPSSGDPSSAPATTRPDLQQPAQPGGQPRDEGGRFAPKPQGQPGQPGQQAQPQEHRVPLRELMEERDRRQRLEAHTQELTRVVLALQQQMLPQQQPQQPQGPETIFDHPEQYLDQRVVAPLRQEGHMAMMQIKDGLSREMANTQFGAEEVNSALGQMQQIRQTPQGDFVFRQIMQSGHPYGELVKWHRTQRAQAAIGADPQAWLRQQQEAWANNPKVQEYVINLVRARVAQQGAQGQAPNVQLPPSLSSVRSSSGRVDNGGDLSSASLYDFATK